jgi:hypothetical protein
VYGKIRLPGTYTSISFTHTSEDWYGLTDVRPLRRDAVNAQPPSNEVGQLEKPPPTHRDFAAQGSKSFTFALTSSVHCLVAKANFEALRERQSRHRTWSAKATPVALPEVGVIGTSKG